MGLRLEVVDGTWWVKGELGGQEVSVDTGLVGEEGLRDAAELRLWEEEAAFYGVAGAKVRREAKEASEVRFGEALRSYMMARHNEGRMPLKACWELDLLEKRVGRETRLGDVDMEAYKAKRFEEGAKPGSVLRELKRLKAVFSHAVAMKMAVAVPKVEMPRVRDERMVTLEDREVVDLLGFVLVNYPMYYPVVMLLCDTGARWNEAAQLRWDCVDLEHGDVQIGKHREYAFSKTIMRTVPMTTRLMKWAQARVAEEGGKVDGGRVLLEGMRGKLGKNDKEMVSRILAMWGKVKGLRVHDLRHSFAYRCARKGIDIADLMFLMGHSNVQQTMRYRGFCRPRVAEVMRRM